MASEIEVTTHHVIVNRRRSVTAALKATGFLLYKVHRDVIREVPLNKLREVELCFLKLGPSDEYPRGTITYDQIAKLFVSHNLVPDPIALAAFNEANPTFVNERSNCTLWRPDTRSSDPHNILYFDKDKEGRFLVLRGCNSFEWPVHHWSFAGIRQ